MRRVPVTMVFVLFLIILSAGCGRNVSVAEVLSRNSISQDSVAGMKVEIRFLKESKGSNYKYADVSRDTALVQRLLESFSSCKASGKPEAARFSPELKSDCEIVFLNGDQAAVSFYYVYQQSLLIYPEWKKEKDGNSVSYLYFSADSTLTALLQGLRQRAQLMQETAVKPFQSIEELKSSIDSEELREEGTELDFEFFTEALPQNDVAACQVYTSKDISTIPADSVLIAAYGKTKTGEQQKLSILGMEANTYYTKILVSEPDSALDSVDTGDGSLDANAVIVKKMTIDPSKWIVFVDENNTILDVVVPEDIEGIASYRQPGASAGPTGSIEPGISGTNEPEPSDSEAGPGD